MSRERKKYKWKKIKNDFKQKLLEIIFYSIPQQLLHLIQSLRGGGCGEVVDKEDGAYVLLGDKFRKGLSSRGGWEIAVVNDVDVFVVID